MPLKIGGGWNYRVLRYPDGALGVHEVFYTDGKPTSCTEDPIGAVGDDLEELRRELEAMLRGLPSCGTTGSSCSSSRSEATRRSPSSSARARGACSDGDEAATRPPARSARGSRISRSSVESSRHTL